MSHPLLHKAPPTTRRGRTGRRRRTARSTTMHDHSDIIRGRVVKDEPYVKFFDWLRHYDFPKTKMVLAEFPSK
ncbi:hypothetical protein O0I10_002823 [Lichtheimia ornata]|uniref:Uncharacterized protein n=1 Tax=Lichtheimia ornata TaxID=688661 RepID=A0AAD7V9U0_9FUNG|nr:uncharacterized protein O0I10_002823 [Lichtheimia ornata]KAJ8661555.1 hypothetical protein O0I10_002823 [Lichtheimia ornata]